MALIIDVQSQQISHDARALRGAYCQHYMQHSGIELFVLELSSSEPIWPQYVVYNETFQPCGTRADCGEDRQLKIGKSRSLDVRVQCTDSVHAVECYKQPNGLAL